MAATMKKHREEMDSLKQLTVVQETFIIALRHRWNQEHVDELHEQISKLQEKATTARATMISPLPSNARFCWRILAWPSEASPCVAEDTTPNDTW